MKLILFFVSIAFSVPIYSSDLITSLQKQCASQSEEELPKDTYLRFIQQMEFQKAKSYCDTLERDPKNCKASSRFWLASVFYAERRFEEA
ncbi:hypothetical protein LPTSP4_00300 [Leptospira ryugenii]|uniref:Tetratricopeptide repeat protein n=1 Tax=Leptospira ryugenii TaxID=1917863 RepID=A0A2P2DV59_9LEPT|nr:hypothetical protein [Leptospira ryugenii]GBF48531.1 hypothetical protein LPTSP4_00300 [Leptospira ryugenii]